MADGAIADEVREVVVDLGGDLVRQCVADYRTLSNSRAHRITNTVCARGANKVTAIRNPTNLLHCPVIRGAGCSLLAGQ